MTDQTKGLLITLMGVLFVVPDALFAKLIVAEPLTIAFWRVLNASVLIGVGLLLWQGTAPFRAVLGTGKYGVVYALGTGASGVLFVLAVNLTSVANVVFIIASMPVFATLYSRVFLAEPIRPRMLLTMAAVAVGLAIIAYGSAETEQNSFVGDLLALAVSALFAAGLTAARFVRPVSMVAGVPLAYLAAAAVIAPFAAPLSMPSDQWPLVAAHAGFIMFSSICLALGPRYITSAEVSLLVLGESVLAPLLVWAVLEEHPGRWALVGGAVVLSALFVSNLVALLRQRARDAGPRK